MPLDAEPAGAVSCQTVGGGTTKFIPQSEALSFKPRIWDEIPREVMARLQQVPYFTRGYEPDGLTVDEFDDLTCLQSTAREFSTATDGMVSFVREHGAIGVSPPEQPVRTNPHDSNEGNHQRCSLDRRTSI